MNAAIMRKTISDALPLLLIMCLAIFALELLIVGAMSQFAEEFSDIILAKPLFQRFARLLVGADLSADLSPTTLVTIGYAHPLLYAFTWTFLLATCTRVLAGEIERGTADLLLGLPLSRAKIYTSVSLVCLLAGLPIGGTVLFGTWVGETAFSMWEPLDLPGLAVVTVNMLALYVAIGSGTLFAASLASRRGPAIAAVLAILLGSFLLSFLGQFWTFFERINFLSILHYYQPLPIIRAESWPWGHLVVLLSIAAAFWLLGLWRFTRRDIPAA
jgi:ABC-2 type transport system permease protein